MATILKEFLKFFTIISFLGLIIVLLWCYKNKVETAPAWSAMTAILGYWFGSSKGSAEKTAMLSNQNQSTPDK